MQAEFATAQSCWLINCFLLFSGHHFARWSWPAVANSTWHYKIRHQVDRPMHALLAILWQVFHIWSHIQQFYMPYNCTAASIYFPGCQRLPRSGSFFTCRVLQTGTRHPLTIWHYCSVTLKWGEGERERERAESERTGNCVWGNTEGKLSGWLCR